MVEKWFEIIFDHRISLRERMFRVVTAACMIALVFVLLMGRTFSNLLILAIRQKKRQRYGGKYREIFSFL